MPAPPGDFAERALDEAGPGPYLLDLGGTPPPAVRQWLETPARTRVVGSIYTPDRQPADDYWMSGGTPGQWFDVVIHRRELTATRLL